MGGVVDSAFGAVLERNRDHFNARFVQARRTLRGLEAAPFLDYLRLCVEPAVVAAVDAGHSDVQVDRLARAMYGIGLELVGSELAGPQGRYPVVSRLWRELLPRVVGVLSESAQDTIAALTNAVVNLTLEPGVDAQTWLDAMLDLTEHIGGRDELLRLGQLLAWRGGMAHYRDSVLEHVDTMSPALLEQVFGPIDPRARWGDGDGANIGVVRTVGDFRGLGGSFESPPEVLQAGGRLYAFDNDACYSVHADRFGAVLKRYARTLPTEPEAPAEFRRDGDGHIVRGEARFALPPGNSSVALADDMALVALAHSHRVLIVAPV